MVDRVPRSFGLHKLTLARMFVGVKSNLEKGESDIPLPAKAGSPLSRLLWGRFPYITQLGASLSWLKMDIRSTFLSNDPVLQ